MIQEKHMSCGPACVAMAKVYYTSSITANLEAETRRLSQYFPGGFTESDGTDIKNLAEVLRREGVATYDACYVANVWTYLYAYAKDSTQMIVHVKWTSGAHFSLCPQVYKADQRCVFLDPWYGLVEIPGPALPSYTVQDPTGNFPAVAAGTLSGWILVTKR
jgi:hypothetical protein